MRKLSTIILVLVLGVLSWNCKSGSTESGGGSTPGPSPQQQGATYWWNDVVFYEIFLRSYCDSDGDGIGDIRGLIQKLDYLNDGDSGTTTDLGVTGIWLMPVTESPGYHGYDVEDYRAIERDYGTEADFRELVEAVHARGMYLIIDFVMNHTSSQHPWFIDSASGTQAVNRNWYRWAQADPGETGPWGQQVWHRHENGEYYYGLFWSGMPDLNFAEPAVRAEMKTIANYWLTEMDIDGFRCDAVKYIDEDDDSLENTPETLEWWREFSAYYKEVDPRAITVGEAWDVTEVVAGYVGGKLDICFEFDLATAILTAVQNGTPALVSVKMEEMMDRYPYHQYGTFLSNHDQDRVFSRFGGDEQQAKLAAGVYLTLPGVPFIYYGEEVGMLGVSPDPDRRRPMQWSGGINAGFSEGEPWHEVGGNYEEYNVAAGRDDGESIWRRYRDLIGIRAGNAALRKGTYQEMEAATGVIYAYIRQYGEELVVVVANFSATARESVALSVAVSNVAAGTYKAEELLRRGTVAGVTVGNGGKIEGWSPLNRIEGRETYILKLTKQ
ncbi:MAG: alpha-amylase [bacterium]|nr:alpha-amylase [bacterium]